MWPFTRRPKIVNPHRTGFRVCLVMHYDKNGRQEGQCRICDDCGAHVRPGEQSECPTPGKNKPRPAKEVTYRFTEADRSATIPYDPNRSIGVVTGPLEYALPGQCPTCGK